DSIKADNALAPPPAALGLLRRRVGRDGRHHRRRRFGAHLDRLGHRLRSLRDHRFGWRRDRRSERRRWRRRGVRGHCRLERRMLDRHVAARHLLDRLAVKRRSGLAVDGRRRLLGIPAVALGALALAILASAPAASAAATATAATVALFAILFTTLLAAAFAGLGGRAFAAFFAKGLAFGLHRAFGGSRLIRRCIVSVRGSGVGAILTFGAVLAVAPSAPATTTATASAAIWIFFARSALAFGPVLALGFGRL